MCPFRSKKVSGSELDLTNLTMTKICSLANRIDNELRKDDHMNTEEEVAWFYIFTRSRITNLFTMMCRMEGHVKSNYQIIY